MVNDLFNWLLDLPQYLASFGNWLVSPLNEQFLDISPLALLSIGGTSLIIAIIGIHIIRLFVG